MAVTRRSLDESRKIEPPTHSRKDIVKKFTFGSLSSLFAVNSLSILREKISPPPFTLSSEGMAEIDSNILNSVLLALPVVSAISDWGNEKAVTRRTAFLSFIIPSTMLATKVVAQKIATEKGLSEAENLLQNSPWSIGVRWIQDKFAPHTEYFWPKDKVEPVKTGEERFSGGIKYEFQVPLVGENGPENKKIVMHVLDYGHVLNLSTTDKLTGNNRLVSAKLPRLAKEISGAKSSHVVAGPWFRLYIGANAILLDTANTGEQKHYVHYVQEKTIMGLGATNTSEDSEGVVLNIDKFFERILDPNFLTRTSYTQNILKLNKRSLNPNWFVAFVDGTVQNCTLEELRGLKDMKKDILSITPVIAVMNESMNVKRDGSKYPENEANDCTPMLNVIVFFRDDKNLYRYATIQADFACAQGNCYSTIKALILKQFPNAQDITVGLTDSEGSRGYITKKNNGDWSDGIVGNGSQHEVQAVFSFEKRGF